MRTSIATVVMLGWLGQAMAANSTTDFTFALECRSATSQTNKWGYTAETNCNPPMVQYFKQRETWDQITLSLAFGANKCGSPYYTGSFADLH